jgi:hypothetical protein
VDINNEAARINAQFGGGRGDPILKPTRSTLTLDDYTREQIEAYAGTNGLTFDEAVAAWLNRHAHTFGYNWRGN